MLLQKKNLLVELQNLKQKNSSEENIMRNVEKILSENEAERDNIKNTIASKSSTIANAFHFEQLESNLIFHIDDIKKLCINYRLRFLDSYYFKNPLPEEAISKIHSLEKTHQIKIQGFRIMAPAELFQLENYDDPLLFAPIGNDYYYLIHKWGNDMNPLREWYMKPFKTMGNFIIFLLVISLLIATIIPSNSLGKTSEGTLRLVSFLFIFKSLMGISIYYCFWQGKNFSENIWLSKYYNK